MNAIPTRIPPTLSVAPSQLCSTRTDAAPPCRPSIGRTLSLCLAAFLAVTMSCGRNSGGGSTAPAAAPTPAQNSGASAAPGAGPSAAATAEPGNAAARVAPSDNAAAAPAAAPAQAPDAPAAEAPAATPAAEAGSIVMHERAVAALLDRWLQAQNTGDFGAYEMLYAEKFEGIRRSGAAMRSFARKGWLADRKRMFAKAMAVEAKERQITVVGGMATVVFQQLWQSGNYRDAGPKQLIVVREGTELRIAREEMVASQVEAPAQAAPIARTALAPVVSAGDAMFVLLASGDMGLSEVARGEPTLVVAEHVAMARKTVTSEHLDEPLKQWVGRNLVLHGPQGLRCRGQVTHIELLSRVEPHFSTVQRWKGEEGETKPSDAEIRDEVWSLGQAGLQVVGHFVPVRGESCRGALWAHVADATEPAALAEAKVEPSLLALALRSARALSGWKARQRDYAEATALPRPEHWDAYDGGAPQVRAFTTANGERLLWLSLRAGTGCGDFLGEFWALWQVQGEGAAAKLRLLSDDREPGRIVRPEMAVDADGDSRVELIGVDGVLRAVGPTWRIEPSWELPSLDCGC